MNYTKRSVLYIGYECNAHCVFCYFKFKKGFWRPLEEVKRDALRLREKYGNEYVDITGGEPSIYPWIIELIEYCVDIGLIPTIITNAIVLHRRAAEFKKAGLRDCLISVHATKDTADEIYGRANVYPALIAGIKAAVEKFGFWRSNTCILKQNYKDLERIAAVLIQNDVKIANFIAFNPYHEWKAISSIDCQVKHSEAAPYLRKAIDMLEKEDIEVNVRYFPFCQLKGYEKNIVNWRQLSFDKYEWDLKSWLDPWYHWLPGETKDTMAFKVSEKECVQKKVCKNCNLFFLCDGFSRQYAQRFGFDEIELYQNQSEHVIDTNPFRHGFIVIAYYTRGTEYEKLATRFREAIERYNLQYEIQAIENLGSWQKNTHHKAVFIKEMLLKHTCNIVYVDIDAVFHRYPAIFHKIESDIAVHYFHDIQLASGTIFMKNQPNIHALVDMWIEENRANPQKLDQENLQNLLSSPSCPDITVTRLPEKYCKIFDLSKDPARPVIEHYQASRENKTIVKVEYQEKQKYRDLWRTTYKPSCCALPLVDYIHRHSPGGKLLDVGCGDGTTMMTLRAKGHNCFGVDITTAGCKTGKEWLVEAPLWRLPFGDNAFDFTFSTDVLEHLPPEYIEPAIKEIFRVTRKKTFHCIATFSDTSSGHGVELHLTVKPIEWWREQFSRLNENKLSSRIVSRRDFLAEIESGSEFER